MRAGRSGKGGVGGRLNPGRTLHRLKKQWVLGPIGLIQPQETDHIINFVFAKEKSEP